MPTTSLAKLPKSKSAEEFETLCKDILINMYNLKFEIYGRKGQCQKGIDIRGLCKNNNYIVAQCKNYFNQKSANSLINKIKDDIERAEELPFNIEKFIVMTALDRDVKVQNAIDEIRKNCSFDIETLFWDDIEEDICNSKNLINKYYPFFFENKDKNINIETLVKEFNNNIFQLSIVDFIRTDPSIGILCELVDNVDAFNIIIEKRLNDYLMLQNDERFKAIKNFNMLLWMYSGYLAIRMQYNGGCYYNFKNHFMINEFEEVENTINMYKSELNKNYKIINKGLTLFY